MNTAISLRIKLILLFLFLSLSTFSQNRKYEILGKVDVENGTTAGLKVTIFENAKKLETSSVGRNGKFQYKLDFGNDYMLVFKKEGFVTKKVSISTFVPTEILEQDNRFPPFHFNVTLFPVYEGIDLSIFDQPMGMIMYDKELDDFAYDKDYDKQIRDVIKKAEEEARKKAKELAAKEKKKERAYKEAITKGDVYFKDKKYDLAKLGYEDALSIKSNAEYPKNQILKIEQVLKDKAEQLAKQKALNEQYQGIIAQADKEFQAKDYTNAKTNYQAALEVKPKEEYPKNQINKIDDILKEQAKQLAKQETLDRKYQQIIEKADEVFNAKKYTTAKNNYQSALKLKTNEPYPQDQITKIDAILTAKAQKLAEQKALEEKYQQLITDADKTFKAKNYANAKTIYQSALNIKSNEEYPQNQISKIDKILTDKAEREAKQKALQEEYQQIIVKADKEFQEKKYTEAKTDYLAALKVKAKEEYPQNQINKIDDILKEKAKQLAEQKDLDRKYQQTIEKADKAFSTKKYTVAKDNYQSALKLKTNEPYPQDQITKIDAILADKAQKLAEQKALEEKYQQLITDADKTFNAKNYINAKTIYQSALSLKPNEEYPQNQISKIDKILTDKAEREAQQKALQEEYQQIIVKADKEFQEKKYTEAKTDYLAALKVKAKEEYPQDQINKIDDILKEQAKQLAKQKDLDRKYQQTIEKADKAFNTKKYTVAKDNYQSALKLKANELYPQNQITKINVILTANAQKLAEQKAFEEKYQQLIADADKTFKAKNYINAKTIYQSALSLKPNEEYPQNQISKIDKILTDKAEREAKQKALQEEYQQIIAKADKEFQEKKYTEAKTDYLAALKVKTKEEYPQNQIEKIETIWANQKEADKKYNKIIKLADKKFKRKKYELAKVDFETALALKPEATYPKTQLEKIEAFLLQQEKEKAALQQLALQKQQKEEAFNKLIKDGDDLFNNKKYIEAKSIYLKGLEIHENSIYLKKQIAKIETQLLIQLRAQKLQKEKDERYNMLVKKADEYYEREIYKTATARYKMALKLKPEATYPQEQIDKINDFYEEQKELDKIYRELIKIADQNYANKKYNLAKTIYQKALSTKPSAEYPREIIAKIDTYHLGELHKYAESKMNDIRYKELKIIADNQFEEKQYEEAKKTYKNMLEINPQSKYPKEQIAQIDAIFAARQRKVEAFLRLTKEKQENEKQYKLLVANGDRLFKDKLWEEAIVYYQKAVAQRSEDNYPKEQIKKAKKEIARINSIKENFEAKEKTYNELITSGDKHFSEKDFKNAKIIYNKAIEIKKNAEYPKKQLRRIAITEGTQAKAKEKQLKIQNEYNEEIAKADNFFEKEKFVIARHHYQAAIKIKSDETYPKKQLKEIDKLIEIINHPENLNKAKLAKREKDYSVLIKKGDNNFKAKHYTVAKIMYKRALKLFQRDYPKRKLDEITILVKEGRIALLTEAYQEAITKGDGALKNKEYGVAKFYYRKAIAMVKNEGYPHQQLKEVERKLKEKKETEKQIAYKDAINKADKNLKQGNKGVARFYYKKALRLQPKADYPVQQLKALNSN